MRKLLLPLLALLCVAGCGNQSPPSVGTIQQKAQYFQLTRPDGTLMECVEYGSATHHTQQSKSWFSFTCDWGNAYTGRR